MTPDMKDVWFRTTVREKTAAVLVELRKEHELFDQQLTNQHFSVFSNTLRTDEFCTEVRFSTFNFVVSTPPLRGTTLFDDIKFNIKRCVGIWNAEEQASWFGNDNEALNNLTK